MYIILVLLRWIPVSCVLFQWSHAISPYRPFVPYMMCPLYCVVPCLLYDVLTGQLNMF
jgi:hypothetical protein